MNFILDTYAWIEYFIGSEKGSKVKKLFKNEKNKFYTVICCLAEIKGWTLKNNVESKEIIYLMKTNSEILQLTEEDWIKAAKEKNEQRKSKDRFGLIDATLLVKQKDIDAKIVTGDKHFAGFKDTIFI